MKKVTKASVLTLITAGILMGTTGVKATDVTPTPTPSPTPTSTPTPTAEPSPTPKPWTDESKLKFTLEKSTTGNQYELIISGLENDENLYRLFISNGEIPKVNYKDNGLPEEDNSLIVATNLKNIPISSYLKNIGDVYITLVESRRLPEGGKYESKELVKGLKIERPELNPLGTRIQGYFFAERSNVFVHEPMINDYLEIPITVKVGKITDKDILHAIKNKESNALSKLLDYAKSANSIYVGTMEAGNGNDEESITTNLDVVDDEYCYVYFTTGDGYYPVEDVSLYQVQFNDGKKYLFDYLSDEFKWNLGDEEKPGETTPTPTPSQDDTTIKDKLPQTGQTAAAVVITGIAAIAGTVFFVKSKKYKV